MSQKLFITTHNPVLKECVGEYRKREREMLVQALESPLFHASVSLPANSCCLLHLALELIS